MRGASTRPGRSLSSGMGVGGGGVGGVSAEREGRDPRVAVRRERPEREGAGSAWGGGQRGRGRGAGGGGNRPGPARGRTPSGSGGMEVEGCRGAGGVRAGRGDRSAQAVGEARSRHDPCPPSPQRRRCARFGPRRRAQGSPSPALGLSPLAEPAGGLRGAQTLEGFLRQESEVVAAQVPRLPGRHRPPR